MRRQGIRDPRPRSTAPKVGCGVEPKSRTGLLIELLGRLEGLSGAQFGHCHGESHWVIRPGGSEREAIRADRPFCDFAGFGPGLPKLSRSAAQGLSSGNKR